MRQRNIAKEERSKYVYFGYKIILASWVYSFILFFFFSHPGFFCLLIFRLITEAIQKMKGKIPEIACSHVSSRVLQVLFPCFFPPSFLVNYLDTLELQVCICLQYPSFIVSFSYQTCVKYCSQTERDAVFDELKPHFLNFATNTYAVHLVTKMLDNGTFFVQRIKI